MRSIHHVPPPEREGFSRGYAAGLQGLPRRVPPPSTHDVGGQQMLFSEEKPRHRPRRGSFATGWLKGWDEGARDRAGSSSS